MLVEVATEVVIKVVLTVFIFCHVGCTALVYFCWYTGTLSMKLLIIKLCVTQCKTRVSA